MTGESEEIGVVRTLILFDIDGTLLLTDGAGRSALRSALLQIFGVSGPCDVYDFHGKTDPQIVFDLMSAGGLERDEIERRLPELWPVYVSALERELEVRQQGDSVTLLPGVGELLEVLESRADVLLGLLTGNIEQGARLKLAAAGVTTKFQVGGFGSDSPVRMEIARIAAARAESAGYQAGRTAVVVVGDTPVDVACGRELSGRAVAVATGRHGPEELADAGADAVFEDFRNTADVVSSLLGYGDGDHIQGSHGGGGLGR